MEPFSLCTLFFRETLALICNTCAFFASMSVDAQTCLLDLERDYPHICQHDFT